MRSALLLGVDQQQTTNVQFACKGTQLILQGKSLESSDVVDTVVHLADEGELGSSIDRNPKRAKID